MTPAPLGEAVSRGSALLAVNPFPGTLREGRWYWREESLDKGTYHVHPGNTFLGVSGCVFPHIRQLTAWTLPKRSTEIKIS